jgi:hypothetical protein
MSINSEITATITEIGAGFEVFKKRHDGKVAQIEGALGVLANSRSEMLDRVEELEAGRKMLGKPGSRSGAIARLAKGLSEHVTAGKIGSPFEFRASLADIRQAKVLVGDAGDGSPTGPAWPIQAQRVGDLLNNPRRQLRLLDVLPHIPVTSNSVEGVQLNDDFVHGAAMQSSEGAAKSPTTILTQLMTRPVETFATYTSASRQVLSDEPRLSKFITDLLAYGVLQAFESYCINNGTYGLLTLAPSYSATATPPADKIGEAAAYMQSLGWNPDVLIVNPLDLFAIRSERATGGSEEYVTPAYRAGTIWDLTPIATPALASGTAIVIDSSQCPVYDRESVTVLTGYVSDGFTKNILTLLVEARYAFGLTGTTAAQKVSIGSP